MKKLEKIRCKYILQNVFSFIEKKTGLQIVKYNKDLQKKLNIRLSSYKKLSETFIIYDSKTKGKEYNSKNKQLVFEGDFIHGKRNGIGKEYNKKLNVIFEGEYKNGKRNGNGKEYIDNKLTFAGEYKNGTRNGIGKLFYKDGKIQFKGEYKNGEKNGKGKEYNYGGGLRFIGHYVDGKRNGKGKEFLYAGLVFRNALKENNNNNVLTFEGEYLNGEKNGYGKEYYFNGNLKFEGLFLNGCKDTRRGKEYDEFGYLKKDNIFYSSINPHSKKC